MDKDLKLYYSISEVAQMFDVNESLLRFWEKEFPQLSPKKGSRGVRQYRKEDIRLKAIREELLRMKRALDGFTYEQVEELKKDIQEIEG